MVRSEAGFPQFYGTETVMIQWKRVTTNRNGPHLGESPKSIQFGKHKLNVEDWTEMLETMCDTIAAERDDFSNHLWKIVAGRVPYFHHGMPTEADRDDRRWHRIGGTDMFVRCNLSANNTAELCDALSDMFGYGPIEIELQ